MQDEVIKWKRREALVEDLKSLARVPDENVANLRKLNTKNLNRLCETVSKAKGVPWKPYRVEKK